MAKFKPYKITESQLSSLPIVEGQLIFVTDKEAIYLDVNSTKRVKITSKLASDLTNDKGFIIKEVNTNLINGEAEGSLRTINASENEELYHIGENSFAQGESSKAPGKAAHAEGFNTWATGDYSHAEGWASHAYGDYSHAEGSSESNGLGSHAEGDGTIASGRYSHVQGTFNIKDTSDEYAHIIGNGKERDSRSNAHTLDWEGNAWYAGDVYVGSTSGTNKDSGSVKLVKETDLKTVATSGSYNDLTNKPTIPSIDSILSSTSTNPVQNKVINTALNNKQPKLTAGTNITITNNTISAKDTTYEAATGDTNGLMASTDKTKLDGIASGAEANVQSDWNVTNTSSDAFIKNKPTIPTKTSQLTNDSGYTKNTGTITGVSVNGTSVATSGVANITSIPASVLSGAIKNGVTATTQADGDNSTKVATTAYVDKAIQNLPEPMIFKGSLGTSGTITSLPAAATSNEGYTYKVITAGTYANQSAKVGDTFISDGKNWVLIPSGDEPNGTVTSVTLKATGPISIDNSAAITTSGTRTLSHATSGATAGNYGDSANQTPSYGGTFKVPYLSVNATGHVTGISEHTVKIPASDNTNTTYTLTQDSTDGHKITLTPSSGSPTTITIPDKDTQYSAATTTTPGLMSASDKTKLNGIANNAQVNKIEKIQKNGKDLDITSKTVNISVPTKVSELTNDSGYTKNTGTVTSVSVKMNGTAKGTVTSSGTIDLGTVLTSHQSLTGYAKTADLAKVAKSGNYTDLNNKPTIPTIIDNLTSTSSSDALSANQGKILDTKVSASVAPPDVSDVAKLWVDTAYTITDAGYPNLYYNNSSEGEWINLFTPINEKGALIKLIKTNGAAQAISANTQTLITFSTAEINTNPNIFEFKNDGISVKKAGTLLIKGQYQTSYPSDIYIYIFKNGMNLSAFNSSASAINIVDIMNVEAGDSIQLYCYLTINANVNAVSNWTYLKATLI